MQNITDSNAQRMGSDLSLLQSLNWPSIRVTMNSTLEEFVIIQNIPEHKSVLYKNKLVPRDQLKHLKVKDAIVGGKLLLGVIKGLPDEAIYKRLEDQNEYQIYEYPRNLKMDERARSEKKVLLVVGEEGKTKENFLNSLINTLCNVNYYDYFRYKFETKGQDESAQNKNLEVFDLFLKQIKPIQIINVRNLITDDQTKQSTIMEELTDYLKNVQPFLDEIIFVSKNQQSFFEQSNIKAIDKFIQQFGQSILANIIFVIDNSALPQNQKTPSLSKLLSQENANLNIPASLIDKFRQHRILVNEVNSESVYKRIPEEANSEEQQLFDFTIQNLRNMVLENHKKQKEREYIINVLSSQLSLQKQVFEHKEETNDVDSDFQLTFDKHILREEYFPPESFNIACMICNKLCISNISSWDSFYQDYESERKCQHCPGKCSLYLHTRQNQRIVNDTKGENVQIEQLRSQYYNGDIEEVDVAEQILLCINQEIDLRELKLCLLIFVGFQEVTRIIEIHLQQQNKMTLEQYIVHNISAAQNAEEPNSQIKVEILQNCLERFKKLSGRLKLENNQQSLETAILQEISLLEDQIKERDQKLELYKEKKRKLEEQQRLEEEVIPKKTVEKLQDIEEEKQLPETNKSQDPSFSKTNQPLQQEVNAKSSSKVSEGFKRKHWSNLQILNLYDPKMRFLTLEEIKSFYWKGYEDLKQQYIRMKKMSQNKNNLFKSSQNTSENKGQESMLEQYSQNSRKRGKSKVRAHSQQIQKLQDLSNAISMDKEKLLDAINKNYQRSIKNQKLNTQFVFLPCIKLQQEQKTKKPHFLKRLNHQNNQAHTHALNYQKEQYKYSFPDLRLTQPKQDVKLASIEQTNEEKLERNQTRGVLNSNSNRHFHTVNELYSNLNFEEAFANFDSNVKFDNEQKHALNEEIGQNGSHSTPHKFVERKNKEQIIEIMAKLSKNRKSKRVISFKKQMKQIRLVDIYQEYQKGHSTLPKPGNQRSRSVRQAQKDT